MPRPTVLLNFASSLDGKIAPAPALRPAGTFMMSRGTADRARMRELRATADAILIGAGNLRADNPDLALDDAEHARRRATGEREPLRVVVSHACAGIVPEQRMFDPTRGGPSIVVHTGPPSPETHDALAAVAELVQLPDAASDLGVLIAWLGETHGCRTVLAEGGGALAAALFAARAVDEVYLTLVPRILGGLTAPTMVTGPGFPPSAIPFATLVDMTRAGDELLLRYRFAWGS